MPIYQVAFGLDHSFLRIRCKFSLFSDRLVKISTILWKALWMSTHKIVSIVKGLFFPASTYGNFGCERIYFSEYGFEQYATILYWQEFSLTIIYHYFTIKATLYYSKFTFLICESLSIEKNYSKILWVVYFSNIHFFFVSIKVYNHSPPWSKDYITLNNVINV